jgi:NO-binding membrane sensor protein with MHYT domain
MSASLAVSVPVLVSYHLPTVAVSLLAAILASEVVLFVVSRPKMDVAQTLLGSLSLGSGIAGVHYIGLSAMRGAAKPVYDLRAVALSILLATIVSAIALQLAFRLRDEKGMNWRKIMSAAITGGLIPAMHYSGRWTTSFQTASVAPDLTHTVSVSTTGIVAIGAASIFVLAAAIASSAFDRLKSVQRDTLAIARERELYFQTIAEAVPEILWTADLNGADDYFNQKTMDYTGRSYEQMRGMAGTS